MPSEAEKELLLRVAERMDKALKFYSKPIIVSRDDARIISRVLREAAAEGWRPIETGEANAQKD